MVWRLVGAGSAKTGPVKDDNFADILGEVLRLNRDSLRGAFTDNVVTLVFGPKIPLAISTGEIIITAMQRVFAYFWQFYFTARRGAAGVA
jgi:hypothetical protein